MLRYLLILVALLFLGLATARDPTLIVEISDGQVQASTPVHVSSGAWVATDVSTLAWIAIDSPLAKVTLTTLTDANGEIVVGTRTAARTTSGTTYFDLVSATTLKAGASKTGSPPSVSFKPSVTAIPAPALVSSKSNSAVTPAPASSKSNNAVNPPPVSSKSNTAVNSAPSSSKSTSISIQPALGPTSAKAGSQIVTTFPAFKSLTTTLSTFFTEGTSTIHLVVAPGGRVSLASDPDAAFASGVSMIASKVAGGSPTSTITTLPAFSALKTTLSTNMVVNSKTIPLVVGPGGHVSLVVEPNEVFASAVSSVASKFRALTSVVPSAPPSKVGGVPPTSTISTLPEFSALKSTLSTHITVNSDIIPLVIRPSGRVSMTLVPDASFTSAVSVIASKIVGDSFGPTITTLPIFSLLKTTLTTFFVESGKSVTIVVFPSGKASLTTPPNADFTAAMASIASKTEGGSKSGSAFVSKISSGTATKPSSSSKPVSSSKHSTTSAAPLATITSKYSVSLESFTTSIPGVTGNTVIDTTVGSDHHHTIIPVLFHCFLICPKGGGGLKLFGFPPGPGIYPQFPPHPLPTWPPVITIGADKIPTYSISQPSSANSGSKGSTSKPTSKVSSSNSDSKASSSVTSMRSISKSSSKSSSSSSSCSSRTVSDCGAKCSGSAYVQLNKITYIHSCSTTCSRVSGCRVSATTTTSSASAASLAIYTELSRTVDSPYNPPTTAPAAPFLSAMQVAFNSIAQSLGLEAAPASSSKATSTTKASSTSKSSSKTSSKSSSETFSKSSSKSSSSPKPTTSSKASSTSKAPASNTLTGTIPSNKWASARPVCNSLSDKSIHLFNRASALDGINTYCAQLKSAKIVLSRDNMTPPLFGSAQKDKIAADGAPTTFIVQWSANGCTTLALPPINFGTMDLAKCVANFLTPIDDCPDLTQPKVTIAHPVRRRAPTPFLDPIPPIVEIPSEYWKIGGSWYNDCAYWAVIAKK